MSGDKEKFLESMTEISEILAEAIEKIEEDQEKYWKSLSKEDQLKVFCAVVRRIHKGELIDRGSYRYVLYDVFGFGPESYVPAQSAGYLSLHNAFWTDECGDNQLQDFAKFYGLCEDAVAKFYLRGL